MDHAETLRFDREALVPLTLLIDVPKIGASSAQCLHLRSNDGR